MNGFRHVWIFCVCVVYVCIEKYFHVCEEVLKKLTFWSSRISVIFSLKITPSCCNCSSSWAIVCFAASISAWKVCYSKRVWVCMCMCVHVFVWAGMWAIFRAWSTQTLDTMLLSSKASKLSDVASSCRTTGELMAYFSSISAIVSLTCKDVEKRKMEWKWDQNQIRKGAHTHTHTHTHKKKWIFCQTSCISNKNSCEGFLCWRFWSSFHNWTALSLSVLGWRILWGIFNIMLIFCNDTNCCWPQMSELDFRARLVCEG